MRRDLGMVVMVAVAWQTALGLGGAQPAPARAIRIAAAADLQAVFPDLAARFEREAGVKTSVSFGSSGNFFAQIQNGAPFDLFFSADINYPRQLVAASLADQDSLYQYATGRLVLWTRKDSGIDVSSGLRILEDARVRRVAIANPQLAPYGRAAQAALKQAGVFGAVESKLVQGENISQTAQLVDSGNAQVGLIALSLALGPALQASGRYFEIPESTHPPIEQAAVVVSASRSKAAARAFLAYLQRPEVDQILQRYGFMPAATPRSR